eukprot:13920103-Alexandrium_andersonii.AAC.1
MSRTRTSRRSSARGAAVSAGRPREFWPGLLPGVASFAKARARHATGCSRPHRMGSAPSR